MPVSGHARIPVGTVHRPRRTDQICGPHAEGPSLQIAHRSRNARFLGVKWLFAARHPFRDAISAVMQEGMCENMSPTHAQIRRRGEAGRSRMKGSVSKGKPSSAEGIALFSIPPSKEKIRLITATQRVWALARSLEWLLQPACVTWDGGERRATYERCLG